MSLFWKIAKWVGLVWLALVVIGFLSAAFAQALPSGVSAVYAPTYAGNGVSFAGGSATAANAASLSFGNAANGAVYAEQQAAVALSGGRTATVAIRSAPSALAVAGAVGRFASKVAVPLAVGVALYDLAKELGFTLAVTGGSVVVTQDPNAVSANCDVTGHGSTCQAYVSANLYGSGASCVVAYRTNRCYFDLRRSDGDYVLNTESWDPRAIPLTGGTPSTVQAFEDAVASKASWPSGSAIGRALTDAVKSGEVLPLPAPNQITGPASVPGSPTVVTNPDGSKVTTTPITNITYGPSSVTFNDTTQVTNTSPTGVVTAGPSTAAPTELPKTCGYPGGPACKIDETGTPSDSPLTESVIKSGTDAVKASQDDLRSRVTSDSDKAWAWTFLGAPPLAACEPVQFPAVVGVTPPPMNPCGTVDGIRAFMAWLWAFAGFYVCLGLVREVV